MTSQPSQAADAVSPPIPPSIVYSQAASEVTRLSTLSKSEEIYQNAVKEVLARGAGEGLSEEEIAFITSKGEAGSLSTLRQEIEADMEKRTFWNPNAQSPFRKTSKKVLKTIERFEKVIEPMVKLASPKIGGVVWAGVRSLLIIAREVFDTFDRLVELAEQIRLCLIRFDIYLGTFDIEDLREHLVPFHEKIIKFCLYARRIYKSSSLKMVGMIFKSSIEGPFGDLLKAIEKSADNVDKAASANFMQNQMRRRKETRSMTQVHTPAKLFLVPPRLSKQFTGREDVLRKLRMTFSADRTSDSPHRAALYGLPGVGKSQTAFRYAKEVQDSCPYVFFMRGDTEEHLLLDYRQMGHRLKLLDDTGDADDSISVAKIREWLEITPNWLLVFDDVKHLGTVQNWTPTSGAGNVLYTTRSSDVAENLVEDSSNATEVAPLDIDQAVKLTMRLKNERDPHEGMLEVARKLCESLGCLPIAINQAIEFAKFQNISLITLMQYLERKKAVLDREHATSTHECNVSVWALFLLALEGVDGRNKQASALMKLFVYFDTTSIPVEIIKGGASKLEEHLKRTVIYPRGTIRYSWEETRQAAQRTTIEGAENSRPRPRSWWRQSPFRTPPPEPPQTEALPNSPSDKALHKFYMGNKALRDLFADPDRIDNALPPLRNAGLLRNNGDGTVWIHDLVRDIVLETLSEPPEASHNQRAHLALTMVYLTFPEPSHPNHSLAHIYDILLSYQPHALRTLIHCKPFLPDTAIGPELSHLTASFFHFRAEMEHASFLSEAVTWYTAAFTGYFHVWKRQRQHLHHLLAPASMTTVDATIAYDERAAFALENNLPTGRGGILYRTLDNYERHGGPSRRLFDTALKLAKILQSTNPSAALTWATKAIRSYETLLGPAHDLTFDAMSLLVKLHLANHLYEEGEELALKRADLYEKRSGCDLWDTEVGSQCAVDIASFRKAKGDEEGALRMWKFALRGKEAAFGVGALETTDTLLTVAKAEDRAHQHRLAVEYCLSSREACRAGGSELGVAQARVELGTSLLRLGRGVEASGELRDVQRYLQGIHRSFEEADELTRPLWLKCSWNFGLARLVVGDDMEIAVPADFEGTVLEEAEGLFGKVGDGLCKCARQKYS